MPKAEAASNEAIMLINDNPGQETRIAIMRGGRLDDLLSERPATATSVGIMMIRTVTMRATTTSLDLAVLGDDWVARQ